MTGPDQPDDAHPDAATRVILRLCRELASIRMRYANLLAAARAALSAAREGDLDAFEFLADELVERHGQKDLDRVPRWWDEVDR